MQAQYAVYGTAYRLGQPPQAPTTRPIAKTALQKIAKASLEQLRDSEPIEYLFLACDAWLRLRNDCAPVFKNRPACYANKVL